MVRVNVTILKNFSKNMHILTPPNCSKPCSGKGSLEDPRPQSRVRAVCTCFCDYQEPTETVLIWISKPLISEEATVIGGEGIGTLQSDNVPPFINSNGFKTSQT